MPKVFKPVENYEAEQAFKKERTVLLFDKDTNEIIYLNSCPNRNFVVEAFTQIKYLYYVI